MPPTFMKHSHLQKSSLSVQKLCMWRKKYMSIGGSDVIVCRSKADSQHSGAVRERVTIRTGISTF